MPIPRRQPPPATTLRIAGSTAYRAAVTAAIIDALTDKTTTPPTLPTCAYNGTSTSATAVYGAATAIFLSPDGTTCIETNWTGSLAGVVDTAVRNTNLVWPATGNQSGTLVSTATAPTGVNLDAAYKGGTVGPTSGTTAADKAAPDMAMSDSFAGSVSTICGGGRPSPDRLEPRPTPLSWCRFSPMPT